ncbi:MAG: hypothetical protein KDE33_28240, partial [Bacteroidetes bacterium]|nr:hypothetical protein [Bacteroidota bacterium]
NGEELGVTNNHPIFSNTKGDWEFAGHLEIGEEVLAKSGCTKVVSKELDHVQEVYNLEVKDYHNFLVNASGIVVHNNGLCDFLKSLFNKYKSWRKAEPDWGLDESKVNDLMVALKNNVPEVYSTPIYTTTHNGTTYMVNGHHRLKAAKRLKIEQGIDIELQHYDINPNQIHTIEGGRFKNIQELINQSFGPND